MKVSGFTFLRNGVLLDYPFKESIKSILPIVDEFIVALGPSEDNTREEILSLNSPKIKIVDTIWNEKMQERGYVYGQQKMIAQFNCSGDWAFYLESDEVLHEDDLDKIVDVMRRYKDDPKVEALAFDYLHFYGNKNTYIDSPGWYRREVRVIKNSIRTIAPDGLFWSVLTSNRRCKYPNAVLTGAKIYHYGWIRDEKKMNLKFKKVKRYWKSEYKPIDYTQIDRAILREFKGKHPKVIENWLPEAEGVFQANPNYKLSRRDKKQRLKAKIENLFNLDLSKKHFRLVK